MCALSALPSFLLTPIPFNFDDNFHTWLVFYWYTASALDHEFYLRTANSSVGSVWLPWQLTSCSFYFSYLWYAGIHLAQYPQCLTCVRWYASDHGLLLSCADHGERIIIIGILRCCVDCVILHLGLPKAKDKIYWAISAWRCWWHVLGLESSSGLRFRAGWVTEARVLTWSHLM